MKHYIKILFLFSITFLTFSCAKDSDSNNFTGDAEVQIRSKQGVTSSHGMLRFDSKETLREFIDETKALRSTWSFDPSIRSELIRDFNEQYGYTSLEEFYMSIPEANVSEADYMSYDVMQFVLNEGKEFALGSKIYKYLPFDEVAVIENFSLKGLEDVRKYGLHSTHAEVSYFDSGTTVQRTNIKVDGGNGGGGSSGICTGHLSLLQENGRGTESNIIYLDGQVMNLAGPCSSALRVTIDWGDGTTTVRSGRSFNTHHAYQVGPSFSTGACLDFTINIEYEWIKSCGGCSKGKKLSKTLAAVVCYAPHLCVNNDMEITQTVNKVIGAREYKMTCTLGVDNSWSIFDWNSSYYIEATLFSKGLYSQKYWVDRNAVNGISVDITGPLYAEDKCGVAAFTLTSNPLIEFDNHVEKNVYNIGNVYRKGSGDDNRVTGSFLADVGEGVIDHEIKL